MNKQVLRILEIYMSCYWCLSVLIRKSGIFEIVVVNLDERRSLYKVVIVATTRISILPFMCVCSLLQIIPPRLLHIVLLMNFAKYMPINVFLCFLKPAIKNTPRL